MDPARLIAMANQIARAFAAQGEQAAITQTAQHIRDFWDPRMKATILAQQRGAPSPIALSPIVAAALEKL